MTRFESCKHGGGASCRRQGGSGCTVHKAGYLHPFMHIAELEHIAKAEPPTEDAESKTFQVDTMEPDVEETDGAEDMLDSGGIEEDVPKQLYYFDLQSRDGAVRLIELLPILDPDIVTEIYETIWPGYPVDDEETFNDRVARLEIRGYMMDYLVTNELEPGAERPRQTDLAFSARGEESNQETASESRNEPDDATIPDSGKDTD